MDPNRIGDISEYKAILWLWSEGYEVFRNCGCTGDVDLIATKDGETVKIDVKTVPTNKRSGPTFRVADHEAILAKGIRILWVLGDEVGWNRDYFTFGEG